MAIKMDIRYVESRSMTVQGKREEIYKRYGREWSIQEQGGGNGNWLLTKPSDVLVNGESYRSFVLDYYGRHRLTKKLVDQFIKDVESGKIDLGL